jgi:hypothetical protein
MRDFVPGGVANANGDLYGNSPFYLMRTGRIVLEQELVEAAVNVGWRVLSKPPHWDCDPDFAWLERTEAEREKLFP